MNSISSVKMNSNIDSPKTPGGISRSLLTPCRRVGLSKKINRNGPSPFISPLSGSNNNVEVIEKKEPKRRKICTSDDELESVTEGGQNNVCTPKLDLGESTPNNISKTPLRNVSISKKKSKPLLVMTDIDVTDNLDDKTENAINIEGSPSEERSLSEHSHSSSKKKMKHDGQSQHQKKSYDSNKANNRNISSEHNNKLGNKEKSPNNLTKECIVVIQKKMLKNLNSIGATDTHYGEVNDRISSASQTLFDSDSDDKPLCDLGKENITKNPEEDDFVENKKLIVGKSKDKTTSSRQHNIPTKNRHTKQVKPKTLEKKPSSFDDDDDFECVNKRTIIVKKSYDKVCKPLKAKSTGSITQKDIDELKARIDMKRKLLIAKAMTEDTKELRNLIKKWQKGCQEALFELFDLMRKKLPDSRNMDYSEILQTLKIPPELVGYDVDNDCFVTPDDSSIILSSINT